MTTLQARLEKAMEHGKKSRADLARACDISRAAVAKWFEGNAKNLKMEHLFSVADECGVEARWLATGTGTITRGSKSESALTGLTDLEQRHVDLARMYRRLPEDVRRPIRALIETLAFMHHPNKAEYVKRSKAPAHMVHDE